MGERPDQAFAFICIFRFLAGKEEKWQINILKKFSGKNMKILSIDIQNSVSAYGQYL